MVCETKDSCSEKSKILAGWKREKEKRKGEMTYALHTSPEALVKPEKKAAEKKSILKERQAPKKQAGDPRNKTGRNISSLLKTIRRKTRSCK